MIKYGVNSKELEVIVQVIGMFLLLTLFPTCYSDRYWSLFSKKGRELAVAIAKVAIYVVM